MKRSFKTSRMLSATAALAAVGALLVASDAEAAFKLRLSDGTAANTVTVTDGGVGDNSALTGAINYSGGLGSWLLNISTGLSGPLLAGPFPHMDLNSVNVSGGRGTLTIELTDTDFTNGSPAAKFLVGLGGTTGGDLDFVAYINPDNEEFSITGTKIADLGGYSGGPFSGSDSGTVPIDGPYSVTLIAKFTHDELGQVSSFDAEIQIPEPGSLALFGVGLLGLGFLARRQKAGSFDV